MTGTPVPKPTPRTKRAPKGLRRWTPMGHTWMKRRRPRRLGTAQSNPSFLAFVHELPCCAARLSKCGGSIEAHHAGPKPGMAMKAPDSTAVPLCRSHHKDLTERRGPFAGKTRDEMRALQDDWIGASFGAFLAHGSRRTR